MPYTNKLSVIIPKKPKTRLQIRVEAMVKKNRVNGVEINNLVLFNTCPNELDDVQLVSKRESTDNYGGIKLRRQ